MQFAVSPGMKPTILITATALAFGLLAGCDRKADDRASVTTPATSTPSNAASGSSAPTTTPQANTPTTPASPEGKAEKNPVQQQVDPKEPAQRRDFQQRGDAAGPKSPDTAPKTGG